VRISGGTQAVGALRRRSRLIGKLLPFFFVMAWSCAQAADLRVLCPNALREPALELARSYARASGHRVEFVFASVGAIHKRVATGERADVVIGATEGIAALVKLGSADAGSQAEIVRTALALIALAPAALPAPDQTDAVERALLSAGSFGVPDARRGAPGGAQASELIDALPSAAALRPKIRGIAGGAEAVKLLAAGAIDLALVAMSEVAATPGIALAGPITQPPTRGISYAAVVPRTAQQAELGRAFIAHLRSPAAAKLFRLTGYLAAE